MKAKIALIITLLALTPVAMPGAEANHHVQSGGHSDCLDLVALRSVPGVYSPNAQIITTTPGAAFSTKTEPPSPLSVWIDFYRADGSWIGSSSGARDGRVPAEAVTGTICLSSPVAMVTQPDMQWFYTECRSGACPF